MHHFLPPVNPRTGTRGLPLSRGCFPRPRASPGLPMTLQDPVDSGLVILSVDRFHHRLEEDEGRSINLSSGPPSRAHHARTRRVLDLVHKFPQGGVRTP